MVVFYTSASAAALLAGLAIRSEDIPDDLTQLTVLDPACGTGTLLMSAATRILDLRDSTTQKQDVTVLLSHTIQGRDINIPACNMTAATLGMLSPTTRFRDMQIQRMPFGFDDTTRIRVLKNKQALMKAVDAVQETTTSESKQSATLKARAAKKRLKEDMGSVRIGSLEALHWDAVVGDGYNQQCSDMGVSSVGRMDVRENTTALKPEGYDLVMMNPPYTLDYKRHRQLTDEDDGIEETAMRARERKVMQDKGGNSISAGSIVYGVGRTSNQKSSWINCGYGVSSFSCICAYCTCVTQTFGRIFSY